MPTALRPDHRCCNVHKSGARDLKGRHEALSTAACGALIDPMLEIRLVRFGLDTGKTRRRTAFHAHRFDAGLSGIVMPLCTAIRGHRVIPLPRNLVLGERLVESRKRTPSCSPSLQTSSQRRCAGPVVESINKNSSALTPPWAGLITSLAPPKATSSIRQSRRHDPSRPTICTGMPLENSTRRAFRLGA